MVEKTHFVVKAFGHSFSCDARCPFDVRNKHFPNRDLRCWVQTTTLTDADFLWWLEIHHQHKLGIDIRKLQFKTHSMQRQGTGLDFVAHSVGTIHP